MPSKSPQRGRTAPPLRAIKPDEVPVELTLRQRFEANVQRHNELVNAIATGQQQLAAWSEERLKLAGKLEAQQEILQEQEIPPPEEVPAE